MIFAIGEVQSIFCCQHLAGLLIPTKVVLVANRLAVIVHTIEDYVTMRMFTVNVPGNGCIVFVVFEYRSVHVVMGRFATSAHHHVLGGRYLQERS